ncbi:MFS general substrate transporter [Atractiella rhizophila]|nr:MFS general substrate transporter [Atractiella rhizophila]
MDAVKDGKKKRAEAGAGWKGRKEEEHHLPKNRMWIVFTGLVLAVFLGALDQTLVSTALPAIVRDLGGANLYSWVGTSYLLASACCTPLFGKISDIVGRKPVIFLAIGLFMLGSALCGAAKSMKMLIVARSIQGMGGGGIFTMANIITGDIVPLDKRGNYAGIIGMMWGVASVLGPLIGGVFADHVTWRWGFYINLPTGAVSVIILVLFLNLNPMPKKSLKEQFASFDFVGLASLVIGVGLLLLGFNHAEETWSDPLTISTIAIGGSLILFTGVYDAYTTKLPILPPRLFKTRTTIAVLISVFIHSLVYFAVSYYLPLYYQILGSSATTSALEQIPYTVGSSLVSAAAGIIISKMGDYRWVSWVSWVIQTVGVGTMVLLDSTSSRFEKEFYPFIAGFGVGGLFVAPLIAINAATSLSQMATSTTALLLARQLAGSIGISLGQTIYANELTRRLGKIPDYVGPTGAAARNDVRDLVHIQPPELRRQVLHAYAESLTTVWIFLVPCSVVGTLVVFLYRKYTLKRVIVKASGEKEDKDADAAEKRDSLIEEEVEKRDDVEEDAKGHDDFMIDEDSQPDTAVQDMKSKLNV